MIENGKKMHNRIMMPGKEVVALYPQEYLEKNNSTQVFL